MDEYANAARSIVEHACISCGNDQNTRQYCAVEPSGVLHLAWHCLSRYCLEYTRELVCAPVQGKPYNVTRDCNGCNKSRLGGRGGRWRCGRCRVAVYCNRECQRAHWPEHKKVCPVPEDAPESE